jgi:hypothetical protein
MARSIASSKCGKWRGIEWSGMECSGVNKKKRNKIEEQDESRLTRFISCI